MRKFTIADVGDGLAARLRAAYGDEIQLDCGSTQDASEAAKFVDANRRIDYFILSHFHVDHYNGLFRLKHRRHWLREVFYPRLPDYEDAPSIRRELSVAFLAINYRVFGNESGLMDADFLSLIAEISVRRLIGYQSLAQGDAFQLDGTQFEVFWPPRQITDKNGMTRAKNALRDFYLAVEEDEETRRIYQKVGESGIVEKYLNDERNGLLNPNTFERDMPENEAVSNGGSNPNEDRPRETDLPESVKKANDSLRRVANSLSLVFQADDKFLFLGDLESRDIPQVIEVIKQKGHPFYWVMLTPHHGTHWHESLKRIRAYWVISSVGSRLIRNYQNEFREIAQIPYLTYVNGPLSLRLDQSVRAAQLLQIPLWRY